MSIVTSFLTAKRKSNLELNQEYLSTYLFSVQLTVFPKNALQSSVFYENLSEGEDFKHPTLFRIIALIVLFEPDATLYIRNGQQNMIVFLC